ncbi:hypothetical protein M0804_009400 [Polistes exclamans]|nr:hypothetical protein M0804_009400 [Polistes exclamans]
MPPIGLLMSVLLLQTDLCTQQTRPDQIRTEQNRLDQTEETSKQANECERARKKVQFPNKSRAKTALIFDASRSIVNKSTTTALFVAKARSTCSTFITERRREQASKQVSKQASKQTKPNQTKPMTLWLIGVTLMCVFSTPIAWWASLNPQNHEILVDPVPLWNQTNYHANINEL